MLGKNLFKKLLCGILIGGLFIQNSYAIIDVNVSFTNKENGQNITNSPIQKDIDYRLIINNSSDIDSINANFIHRLPEGIKISNEPNIRSTCGDNSNIQVENDGETGVIKLVNGIVKGVDNGGTCEIKVSVYGNKGGIFESQFNQGELVAFTNGLRETNTGNSRNSINIEGIELLNSDFVVHKYVEGNQVNDEEIIGEFQFDIDYSKKAKVEFLQEGLIRFIPSAFRLRGDDFILENTCGVDIEKISHETGFNQRDNNQYEFEKNLKNGFSLKEGYDELKLTGKIEIKDKSSCKIKMKLKDNFKANTTIKSKQLDSGSSRVVLGITSSRPYDFNEGEVETKQGRLRLGGSYNVSYERGLIISQDVDSREILIHNGSGYKEIEFKFNNADLKNKEINFSHQFPTNGNNGEMIFHSVVSNSCGGSVNGEGTRNLTLNGGRVNGASKLRYYTQSKERELFGKCSLKVKVKVTEEGTYKSIFNYKDSDSIRNLPNTINGNYDGINNIFIREDSEVGHQVVFTAEDSNGLSVNKMLKGGKNLDQNRQSIYGKTIFFDENKNNGNYYLSDGGILQKNSNETFLVIYELKNITEGELNNISIYERLSDGNSEFEKNGEIETTCGDFTEEIVNNSGEKLKININSISGQNGCSVYIPIRLKNNPSEVKESQNGYFYTDSIDFSKGLNEDDVLVNGSGNKSTIDLRALFNSEPILYKFRARDGIYGKKDFFTLQVINRNKENPFRFNGINLLSHIGKDFRLLSFECRDNGASGVKKINDNTFSLKNNGELSGVLNGNEVCDLSIEKTNFTKDEARNMNRRDGIIFDGTNTEIKYVKGRTYNIIGSSHKLNSNEFVNLSNTYISKSLREERSTTYSGLSYRDSRESGSFTLKENGEEVPYLISFEKSNINGGETNRIKINFGGKNLFYGNLKEELNKYGVKLATNLDLRINNGGNSFNDSLTINGKKDDDSLVEGEDYVIENGDIKFLNLIQRSQSDSSGFISFNVTSVKGGNILKTGGGDAFESLSGDRMAESSASFLVRRNINLMSGFKKNKIKVGEKTEYYLEIFNSQLNDEVGRNFSRNIPKFLDISLKENQCGGEVNVSKNNSGNSVITMNGQRISQESSCKIIFDITGKEIGEFDDRINNGTYSTELGKTNVTDSLSTLVVQKDTSVEILKEKENFEKGTEQDIVLRIYNKKGNLRGVNFNFTLPEGLDNIKLSNREGGKKVITNSNLYNDTQSCNNINNISRIEGKTFKVEGLSIDSYRRYCDIYLKITGTEQGDGKELKVTGFNFDGNDGGELESEVVTVNVVNRQVTVKHLEEGTNSVVYSEEILDNNGVAKTDNVNYEYVRGEASQDGRVYTHYYQKKNGKVVVKYIDKETSNEIAGKQRYELNLKWGDNYNVENKKDDIANYSYDSTTGEESGTVSSNETVISHFYNRKQGNIIVEYKLLGTDNEIEQSHTENKKWGENYDVTGLKRTDLDNYTYVSTIGQETGVVGSNEIKITHNYTKKVGRVTVRYIDKDTNQEISNSEVININYLDDYNVESKKLEIEKYVFDSNEGEITGNINKDNNNVVVTYKYSKKRGNITVNYYKDGTTNKIKDSYTEEKKFDETYDLTDKKVDIEKYNFVRTEGEMTGTVSGDVTINHFYTEKIGTVKIKYIDYNTDSELINPIVFTKKLTEADLSYTSQAIGIDNYSFLKMKDGDEANGTIEEGEKIITYYYVKDNRRGISVRFEDEEGNILRPSITVNKTKTGYDINLDEMIKELITGDSIDYRFLQVRQGDKLSCNDSIDCLDKDDVVLLFEPRSIEIGLRNYLKNVEGEHTCNLFGMKYLSEEVNREEFENYLTYIDGGIQGFFNREVLLIGDDNQGGTHENSDKVTNLCIDTSKENGITSKHKIIYGKDGDQDTISMPREFKEGTFGGIREFQEGDDDFDEGEEVGNEILNRVKFTKNNVSFHRLDILRLKNGKFQGNFDLNIELQPITKRIPIIYTNGNEEIRGTEEVSLTVGKSFNIENKKLEDIGDYEFSRVEGNLDGVLGNDMNEVRIVYVKKKGNVTIKYTGDRNESLDNDFTKQFEYGDSYQITPREFEDYDLTSIVKDGNITSDTNGIVNKDNHVIEFKYTKKQGNVITQYIDSETGDIVSTKTNKVRYGDNYTAEKSEIPLYTHEREECVGEGVIDRNNQEVICKYYVTSNKSKVIVKITDSETGEIIRTEEIIGKVGSNYTINLSNIKNYDKDSNEGVELNGVFGNQNKEVTVTYTKKKGNVKIKFIDKETGKVIDEIITNGKAGDKINVNKKDIPGHTFHSSGDIDNLVIQEGENNIELFYTRNDGSVTVKYLDEDGKSIKDDTIITGKYGDDFEIKFEVPEGYSFVDSDSNGNIKGKIDGDESISINFRKNSIKGPGGYAPTKDIDLNDDNRVKINTIISIKQGEEKKEEDNKKEKDKEEVKEPPMIILGDPETKFIFDPIAPIEIEEKVEIEGDNEERKNINIRFPKSGADISEEIVSFEDIINSNGNIPKDHKEQIIKKIKENFSENNGAISLEGNIVIEIDKINNKTDYTLEVTQTEYQSIGEKKVVKTPIKVSLDGFENKSFNYSLFLIILVSVFLSSIFILMRRRKK